LRNLFAALAALAGVVGLAIDAWMIFPSVMAVTAQNPVARSFPDAFVYFWTFFTHLTNLGLILVYSSELSGWKWLGWFRQPGTEALMGGFITLVMLFYHFMLAPTLDMQGPLLWASIILHYLTPAAYLAWWAVFARHGGLRYRDIPWFLLPGILYVAWVLLRGLVVGEYPYEILNADKFGYGGVAIGVGIIFVAVTIFCLVLVSADKLLGRNSKA
jgi:hypothetical protein